MTQKPMQFHEGDAVFREGEPGDTMYVVVTGQVRIVKKGTKEPIVLATLQEGAFFGEMAIVGHTERTATALAATDTTVIPIHASELEVLLKQRPELGAKMMRTLVRRLIRTSNQVVDEKAKNALFYSDEPDS